MQKKALAALAVVLGLLLILWFLRGDGLRKLSDTLIAFLLAFTGTHGALPLFAREAAILTAISVSAFSWLATSKAAGVELSLVSLASLLMIAWLTNRPVLLLMMMPSAAALLIIQMQSSNDSIRLQKALPLALLLTAASFLLVPQGGITIRPLKETAENIRQRIQDYLFYTEPREVFSLASEGYYPNGSSRLGGTAEPNDHLIMMVRTDRSVYLRGTAKNEYTGTGWNDTTGGRRYLWVSPRWTSIRNSVFDHSLPSADISSPLLEQKTVSVQMISSSASDLFVPQRVQDLSCSGDMIPYFNQASEIFATRNLVPGDAWTVRAPLPVMGQSGLDALIEQCAQHGTDPAYEAICSTYTTLPSHLSDQLYDLARSVTADKSTDYAKVQALADYLKTHYRYTLEVDPVPANTDFVSFFLLQTREGYCTYFATALTVMCRMIGLPARYIEGFHVQATASGTSYVTGLEGHAWTEVYFPGFGWLTVDATPGENGQSGGGGGPSPSSPPESPQPSAEPPEPSPSPQRDESEQPTSEPTVSPSPSPSPAPAAPSPSAEPDDRQDGSDGETNTPSPSSFPWIFLILLLALMGLCFRLYRALPEQRARRKKDDKEIWLVWLQEVLDILHVQHLVKEAWETHASFFERLDRQEQLPAALAPLCDCASAVFYGHELPLPDDILLYARTAKSLSMHLPRLKKLQLLFYRAFRRNTVL